MERIGKYEVQAQIGSGGFGRVYRAFDPTVGRTVAIKVILSGGDPDPELYGRFRLEANATGKLRHKNIVTVYDYGEHSGMPYLVIEYLEGRDLHKIITEGPPLSLLEKVTIMEQVAEGLQHAHQNGIVHRDVKPANIMVLSDGSVKIMDFGIARVMREQSNTRLTQEGNIVGTIAYMAPEHFTLGESDQRADIFAYGVIFYELISGQHPFRPPRADTMKIMYNIGSLNPPPVSGFVPDAPAGLDHLVSQAIAKDRESRYQSFEDLRFDVAPVQRELKRRHVDVKVAEAQQAFDAGRIGEAHALVREILLHDASNVVARWMREEIQKSSRGKSTQDRASQLAAAARQYLSAGDYPKAIENIEGALKLDSANTELRPLLEEARQAMARAKLVAGLVDAARRELDAQNLSAAHRLASECLEHAPGHEQAGHLLSEIRRRLEGQDQDRQLEEALGRAKNLAVAGSYTEALALLQDLSASHPGKSAHIRGIAERLRAHQQQEQQRKVSREIASVKELIAASQWQQASAALESLAGEHSSREEVASLAAQVREKLGAQKKADEIASITREVHRLCESQGFDDAATRVERGLRTWPGEAALEELKRSIAEERNRYLRDKAIQTAARRAGELRGAKKYREAIAELDAVIERWHSTDLAGFRDLIESEWKVEQRIAAIAAAERSIEGLLAQQRWQEAVGAAEEVLRLYPGDPVLGSLKTKGERGLASRPQVPEPVPPPLPPQEPVAAPAPPTKKGGLGLAAVAAVLAVAAGGGYFVFMRGRGGSPTSALVVSVTPAGAVVTINDQTCRGSQCRFELSKGNYEIAASMEGYRALRRPLRMEGSDTTLQLQLEPESRPPATNPKPDPPSEEAKVEQPKPEASKPDSQPPSQPDQAATEARRQEQLQAARNELAEWESARGRRDPRAIEAFVAKYPRSAFREEANSLLAQIERERSDRAKPEIQRPPPPQPQQQPPPQTAQASRADVQGVLRTLDHLAIALRAKNAGEITRLYPNVPRQLLSSLRRDIDTYTVEFRPAAVPGINGDTATIQVDRHVVALYKGEGAPRTESDRITVLLRRTPDGWVVDSIQ